ncbi:hypothetical protein BH10ACT11_BH10ACT11_20120 [soil metagenome]
MRNESQTTKPSTRPIGWRALLAVCALVFALTAIGCGSGDSSSDSQSTAASTPSSTPDTSSAPNSGGGSSSSSAGGDTVDIVDFDYDPKAISVNAGDSLEFVNEDTAAHTATADDSSFDTETLEKGDKSTIKFDKPGSYSYYCRFHAFMKATVEVK